MSRAIWHFFNPSSARGNFIYVDSNAKWRNWANDNDGPERQFFVPKPRHLYGLREWKKPVPFEPNDFVQNGNGFANSDG
jgi:hypothetical protein